MAMTFVRVARFSKAKFLQNEYVALLEIRKVLVSRSRSAAQLKQATLLIIVKPVESQANQFPCRLWINWVPFRQSLDQFVEIPTSTNLQSIICQPR